MKLMHLAVFLVLSGAACGPAASNATDAGPTNSTTTCDAQKQGLSVCGNFGDICQPGQYCSDPRFSRCTNGCLSDVHCGCGQRCIKDQGVDQGSCQAVEAPKSTSTEPASAELKRCEAACDRAQECRYYSVGDVVQCKFGCSSVEDVVRKAIADCVSTTTKTSCGPTLPSCFNESCGNGLFVCCGVGAPYTCSGDKTCVGHQCL
ncbi:MAG: hypothetical protein ACT4TC_24125 [Myxococcaceae bacterium]